MKEKIISERKSLGYGYRLTDRGVEFFTVGNDLMRVRYGLGSRIHALCLTHMEHTEKALAEKIMLTMASCCMLLPTEFMKGEGFAKMCIMHIQNLTNPEAAAKADEEEMEKALEYVKDNYQIEK